MKKLISLLLMLGSVSLGFGQRAPQKSALKTMVETEFAFAKMSADQGMRPAFMAFIADNGILFRPRAVNGKQWMAEHPVPPADKRPLLSWYPAIAGVSRAGDLGYTTGPWEFKDDIHDAKPVTWGHFLTVWKKQPVGDWKFVIDLGISNPQPANAEAPWQLPMNYRPPKAMSGRWDFSAEALLARDRQFSETSAKLGARAAFAAYAATAVQLYREGKFPLHGKDLAPAVLPGVSEVWTWEPAAGDVSITDDLGYTYGSYKLVGTSAKVIEAGNYFRIWKKEKGVWQVLFDLTNPIPGSERELTAPLTTRNHAFSSPYLHGE
jgi:ketosteroid isomerase-like protein